MPLADKRMTILELVFIGLILLYAGKIILRLTIFALIDFLWEVAMRITTTEQKERRSAKLRKRINEND